MDEGLDLRRSRTGGGCDSPGPGTCRCGALDVLRRQAGPDAERPLRVVTVPIRSVLQPVVEGLGDMAPVRFARGEELDFDAAVTSLAEAAYARVDMVTRRGEFAVRGGIIDVFSPVEDHPVRIEFFGDEVDELRWSAS